MKSIAMHTLFIVVLTGVLIFFCLTIFWNWIGAQSVEASKTSCSVKLLNYCERWLAEKKDPGDWDSVKPQGCEKFNINRPGSLEECKKILGVS